MYVCDELGFIPQANATRFCCHINLISPIEEVMPEWYHLFFVFPLVALFLGLRYILVFIIFVRFSIVLSP